MSYSSEPSVFDSISQPTLLLDCAVVRENLQFMTRKILNAGVRFRPHFKTHQSAEIGQWFREAGINAITVSSVDMAEYFASAGWQDILIAFSLNLRQLERIELLARKVHLEVLVENEAAVQALGRISPTPFSLWIKVDAGAHRTGIGYTSVEEIRNLARKIKTQPHLQLRGLLTHSGNTYHCNSIDEVIRTFRSGADRLNEIRNSLRDEFPSLQISVGDTPGCSTCQDFSGIDELRPGNFIFYDAQQFLIGSCTTEQIAVAVACPVVALHRQRNEVVVYGGAIHLSKDWLEVDGNISFGLVALAEGRHWSRPIAGAAVRSLSQEHGVAQFTRGIPEELRVGDLLFILPAHSFLTVQALKNYLTLEGKVISTMNSQYPVKPHSMNSLH
jgi:D-serine deaminase-like pyridoxal phosphate-dependent protein